MPDLVDLDAKIQYGRGKAAEHGGGQTYTVFRLSEKTNVSIESGPPILQNFKCRRERTTSKKTIENAVYELLTFEAQCDNRKLQLMDQLVEHGYRAMPQGVYIVAQMVPTRQTLLVRAEANVTISAIFPTAGSASQQPQSGNVFTSSMDGWSGIWKAGEQILTLVNGNYAFASPDSDPPPVPAQVRVGLEPNMRIRDGNTLNVPTEQYRAPFAVYIPITPGVFLEEVKVRLNFGNASSDRYEITKYFTTDLTGLAGQIAMVEKLPF